VLSGNAFQYYASFPTFLLNSSVDPGSGRTRDLTSGDVFFLYRHFSCSTEPRDCACGD